MKQTIENAIIAMENTIAEYNKVDFAKMEKADFYRMKKAIDKLQYERNELRVLWTSL